jgi:hypothetical protein
MSMGGDKGRAKSFAEPRRGGWRIVIIVTRTICRADPPQPLRDQAMPAFEVRKPMAINIPAFQHRFIERSKGLADLLKRNDCATVEPTQRGGILDRPGVRNPRGQNRPLFRDR